MTITLPDQSFIQYSIEDDEVIIENIKTITPGQGIGTQLVKQVIAIANANGLPCTLFAYPQDDSIELSELVHFYLNLGFEIINAQEYGVEMKY